MLCNIKAMSDKPCFWFSGTKETAEIELADGTFKGVLCAKHLFQLLKNRQPKPVQAAK